MVSTRAASITPPKNQSGRISSSPKGVPLASASSFHSLIHENRCRRRPVVSRIDVATVVDCSRSNAALRRG
ncbi:hypothetical protein G6F68_016482 [Rhizopus microsporus]|nr:hypothetical protein G6F68_016482 [Rhizopus microsporus]